MRLANSQLRMRRHDILASLLELAGSVAYQYDLYVVVTAAVLEAVPTSIVQQTWQLCSTCCNVGAG